MTTHSPVSLALVIVLPLLCGCPTAEIAGPTLDYSGIRYEPREFWPLAVGNYWLWMDPDDPNDWYSKKILKVQEIAGADVFLVESTNHVDGGSIWAQSYIVAHAKGLYHALNESTLTRWAQTPDDLSLLTPMLTGVFLKGTLPHPAAYDPDQEYTLSELANVAPFDQCADNDPVVVDGGPEDFLVQPDHLVLLTHTAGICGNATRARITYGCYAQGIGPIVWPGWRRGTLVRAIVDGYEFAI